MSNETATQLEPVTARPVLKLHPRETNMLELFAAQVKERPAATAVVWGREAVSYGELDRRSNQLAHYLRRLGVGPEVRVGVWLPRSLDLMAALFAIIKAGGTYVPLDMTYPQERVGYMLEDSQAPVLLTLESLREDLPGYAGRRVLLDAEKEEIAQETAEAPEVSIFPENIAYLIYTSGSTGRPKAVAIRHQSVITLLHWVREIFSDEELRGVLASTSICFDMSVFEIFGPLSWGGRAIIVNNALDVSGIAGAEGVTLIDTVPSAMAELVRMGAVPDTVQTVNLGGEALPTALVRQVYQIKNIKRVYNLYGPSEDTTFSSYELVRRDEHAAIAPVGIPVSNTDFHVLDRDMLPLPLGETGELYIGGDGLARGYLNKPELTAERFVPDPVSYRPGARLYYTGDRVLHLPDGRLEYLGRVDHQVKIRGFRVELGEVEATLNAYPGVEKAVVLAWEDVPGHKRLVAYVLADGKNPLPTSPLRIYLQQKLPEYMVPSQFVMLEQLPLTPNGKIDRHALPAPGNRDLGLAPQTELERAMARACCEILEVPVVSMDRTFMELGGSSLNATRTIAAIQEAISVRVPISALLGIKTLQEIAQEIEAQRNVTPAESLELKRRTTRKQRFPAAYSQARIWFVQRMNPLTVAYHFNAKISFIGRLNKAALEEALTTFVERHEIYRTTLEEVEGSLFQVVHSPWKIELEETDVENNPARAEQIFLESQKPFNLGALPLARWQLLRVNAEEHVLLVVEHHVIHDGWSFNVFLGELTELYRSYDEGVPAKISPSPLQFGDFAEWQQEWLETREAGEQLEYWMKTLAGVPPLLSLAYDRPRPAFQSYSGDVLRFRIDDNLENALSLAMQRDRATLFMLFAAALETLIYRYSRQEDFCIGTGIANRRWAETKDLTGMLVNNIPLRSRISNNTSFPELLEQVRKTTLEAYNFQDVPFDKIVQAINPARGLSYNPIFQVMLGFHDSPLNCASLRDTRLIVEQALANGSAKFDFNVIVIPPQNHNLPPGYKPNRELLWEYNSALLDRVTAQQMAGHFIRILKEISRDSKPKISEIELLGEGERQQLLFQWNQTIRQYPQECAHQLFEEHAEKTPEALAVAYERQRLTYAELNSQANQLARYLKKLGTLPGSLIGVFTERGTQMVIALLAVLKAGAAYVPLDFTYPPERLRFMIRDAELKFVLVEQEPSAELVDEQSSLRWINLKAKKQQIEAESTANLECVINNTDLAYVMYTSGSTGRPKGMAIEHRNIVKLVRETEYVALDNKDRIAQVSNVSFDAATFEIWGALLNGACLVGIDKETALNPRELARKIRDEKITTMLLSTASFNQMSREIPGAFANMRYLFFGGEAADPQCARSILQSDPPEQIIHVYGPTEATSLASWFMVREVSENATTIPIGHPLTNTQLYVLDQLQPVPLGAIGELFIGGAGVGRGYLNRPALTAEKFVPDPFSGQSGQRLYGTGDLVRQRRDGSIEFIGRVDHQVKIRGFRIELGEIEATMGRINGVKQCAVVLREDQPGEKRLVAYFVPDDGIFVDPAELRGFLKRTLPEYMAPAAYVEMPDLPLTPNGKVDRRALPAPSYGGEIYCAPRTPQEEILCEIFADVLSVERVGIDDNFFDRGGHSLMAMRLVNRVRSTFGAEVPLKTFFESPTVAGLAPSVANPSFVSAPVVCRQRPEHVPLSHAQQRLWFMESIAPEDPLYNIPLAHSLRGKLDFAALQTSVNEIIRHHEVLRTRFCEMENEVVQLDEPQVLVRIEEEDLRSVPPEARRKVLERRLHEEARRAFDLHSVPLLRLHLFQTAEEEHVLLLVMHHLIADGWSLAVFYRELEKLYAERLTGNKLAAKDLPIQYADYVLWLRDRVEQGEFDEHLKYWTEKLAGAPAFLEMEGDHVRPELPTFIGTTERFELSEATTQALRQFCGRAGVTLHMTLLAAYGLLLHRASGQDEVLIGVPVANRSHESLQELIGFFVNMLPIRIDFSKDPTFKELVLRVKATTLEGYLHQDLPFERLVEELKPERSLHRNPLFQVVFNMLNRDHGALHLLNLDCTPVDVDIHSAKFDLYFEIQEYQRCLRGRLICSSDLFAPETGKDLCRRFERLIEQILIREGQPISDLDVLLDDERATLSAATSVPDLEELFRF